MKFTVDGYVTEFIYLASSGNDQGMLKIWGINPEGEVFGFFENRVKFLLEAPPIPQPGVKHQEVKSGGQSNLNVPKPVRTGTRR